MGKMELGAGVLLWIAWFFVPAAGIAGPGGAPMSLTFWNLLGIDFNNPEDILRGGGDHGILAFLGILCIAAPFAAPFILAAWAKYLNAAPLAIVVIGFIAIYMNENKAFGDLVKMGVPNPFSWSALIIVLLIAAVALAAGALKKPA